MLCKFCLEEKKDEFIYKKYKNHCLCKSCKSKQDKEYRLKNKDKVAKYFYDKWRNDPDRRAKNKLMKELSRTGLNATEYVKNKECSVCGMSNKEHVTKWNERLHVHHVDNNGRHNIRLKKKPVHKNLMVLCRSCHVSKDNKENKKYY